MSVWLSVLFSQPEIAAAATLNLIHGVCACVSDIVAVIVIPVLVATAVVASFVRFCISRGLDWVSLALQGGLPEDN